MAPPEESVYLDLAIERIGTMKRSINSPRYLADAQLLAAAIFMLKNDLTEAYEAMQIYRNAKPGPWDIGDEMAVCPFDAGVSGSEADENCLFWETWAGKALALA